MDSTIVAISSAAGHAPVGIVRLSGPDALHIADAVARVEGAPFLSSRAGSTRTDGDVLLDDGCSLPATFYLFRAPHSYTRENMVEIHTVGSPAALELVRQKLMGRGAIPAEPGEFTARAFLNGAMDLGKAEAVAAVIRAQSDTQLRASRKMMDGRAAGDIAALRDELAELTALVEADIDFAEEPIEFITPQALCARLSAIQQRLQALIRSSTVVERFDALPHVLLFGPPNAGKSSLMNCLSGTSRAICAAAAGTTRDILSAPIRLGRGEVILLDTAGIDKSEDEIVAAARAHVLSAAQRVDLLCVVVDLTATSHDHLLATAAALHVARCVIAANKCDLLSEPQVRRATTDLESHGLGRVIPVSALRGSGLDDLKDAFREQLAETASTVEGESVLISARQRTAIKEAAEAVVRAVALGENASETIDCAEVLAFELREALDLLGSVTGQVTTEDLLGEVFANFCIGK